MDRFYYDNIYLGAPDEDEEEEGVDEGPEFDYETPDFDYDDPAADWVYDPLSRKGFE